MSKYRRAVTLGLALSVVTASERVALAVCDPTIGGEICNNPADWQGWLIPQVPAAFNISYALTNLEFGSSAIANQIEFTNTVEGTGTTGLNVFGTPLKERGVQTAVSTNTNILAPSPQVGGVTGSLSQSSSFFAQGRFQGVTGSGVASTLINFNNTLWSDCLGGFFTGGAEKDSVLWLDGNGRYYVGGAYGEVTGRIDGEDKDPWLANIVAGIIGRDTTDPRSTAQHYAGFFEGAVRVTGDLFLDLGSGVRRQVAVGDPAPFPNPPGSHYLILLP